MKFEISRQILKNERMSNFMKIHPLGADLFRVDRQTEREA